MPCELEIAVVSAKLPLPSDGDCSINTIPENRRAPRSRTRPTRFRDFDTGFCFEARQFRVTAGNEHDRVDLVFSQRRLRCHVLFDLKIRAFNHAVAG